MLRPVVENSNVMNEPDDSYLIVVDYKDDAERKRAEYLLDNWDHGTVESLSGLSRIVEDDNIDGLYEELVTKVPENQIDIFGLSDVDTQVAKRQARLDEKFTTSSDKVEWAMEAIMNKRKTIEKDPQRNIYNVYTKKGRSTVEFSITEAPGGKVHLTGTIEGYGEAPEFLKDYILDEIQYMI